MTICDARYYDAALGRFTQPDTIVPNPANPQSLNRYSYVLNNPLKYADPSGHCPTNPDGSEGCERDRGVVGNVIVYEGRDEDGQASLPSTKEFIKKYRDAQAQIKSACIDAGCYHEDTWWMVDPFEAWDDEQLALLIDESKSAYLAAGLSFDDIVNQKLNNKLDVQSLKPSQSGNLILQIVKDNLNPVLAKFLLELHLDTVHMANREPMYIMAQIVNNTLFYVQTVDACLNSEHCGRYGGPITFHK